VLADGGGVSLNNVTDTAIVTASTVESNTASGIGGGLYLWQMPANSTASITRSTITVRLACGSGEALAHVVCRAKSEVELWSMLYAVSSGTALLCVYTAVLCATAALLWIMCPFHTHLSMSLTCVTSVVVQNNTATELGGGVAIVGGSAVALTLASSTLSNNKVSRTGSSAACSLCHIQQHAGAR